LAGVDVILSSDMHEITREPVLIGNKTLVRGSRSGRPGDRRTELTVDNGQMTN